MRPLSDPALAVTLFAVLAIMLYGVMLSHVLPRRRHFMVNVLFAAVAVGLGLLTGLSPAAIGLSLGSLYAGLPELLAVVVVIMGGAWLGAYVPAVRHGLRNSTWLKASRWEIAHAIGLRIPLSTVLLEEVLFRGLLLGLLLQVVTAIWALALSALLFGLWHVSPLVAEFEANGALAADAAARRRQQTSVALTVVMTTLAGLGFGGLRLWAGSLLAPWLVHWVLNASGVWVAAALRTSAALKKPD